MGQNRSELKLECNDISLSLVSLLQRAVLLAATLEGPIDSARADSQQMQGARSLHKLICLPRPRTSNRSSSAYVSESSR